MSLSTVRLRSCEIFYSCKVIMCLAFMADDPILNGAVTDRTSKCRIWDLAHYSPYVFNTMGKVYALHLMYQKLPISIYISTQIFSHVHETSVISQLI